MRGILRPWFVGLLTVGLWGSLTTAVSRAQAPPFLIGKEEVWKYSAGGSHPPEGWTQVSFDDKAWKSGRAGFGYGDSDDVTVLEDMRNRYTAVYIRKSFDLERLAGVDSLYLYVKYDDGFIAYLNGKQVASASVKQDADGIRVEQHEAEVYEEFAIRDAKSLLRFRQGPHRIPADLSSRLGGVERSGACRHPEGSRCLQAGMAATGRQVQRLALHDP